MVSPIQKDIISRAGSVCNTRIGLHEIIPINASSYRNENKEEKQRTIIRQA